MYVCALLDVPIDRTIVAWDSANEEKRIVEGDLQEE